MSTVDTTASLTETEARNAATVRRVLLGVWQDANYEIADEVFPPSFIRHDPAGDATGPEDYKKKAKQVHEAFSDIEIEIHSVIAKGDEVAFHNSLRATHTGTFQGIRATGARIDVQTFTRLKFNEDGTCAEAWVLSDYLGMVTTLVKKMTWWQRLTNFPAMIKQSGLC